MNMVAWAEEARTHLRLERDSMGTSVTLNVGDDDWPSPIPLVTEGDQWRFNAAEGRDEILRRRVGRNELNAIDLCRGYVEAQRQYARVRHDGALVNQYAQRIISTPGKQDGLTWRTEDGSWEGPVSEGIAEAIADGYSSRTAPFNGYYFKVLKGQGPAAPLGELDFVLEGAMIGGFALVAGARGLRRYRHHDVHREPRRDRVREGPRGGDAGGLRRNGAIRPGLDLDAGVGELTPAGSPDVVSRSGPGRSGSARRSPGQ